MNDVPDRAPVVDIDDLPDVGTGLTRYRRLFQLFRDEKDNPRPFYATLAREAVADLEARHGRLAGKVVADLGCGPGFYTEAFRSVGATCHPIDGDFAELQLAGAAPRGSVQADAARLPFPTGSFDAVFCSNLLEHASDTAGVIAEMARTLRPGGWGYLSWTNWYSPWGGHDMSPYHYLGPRRGSRLYEKRHGPPRKNRFGEGLFAVHIGPTIRLVEQQADLRITAIEPRYYPWARGVMKVPGLREVVAWNCLIRFERR